MGLPPAKYREWALAQQHTAAARPLFFFVPLRSTSKNSGAWSQKHFREISDCTFIDFSIANYLTEHNYPTPSKRGTKWQITTIASILRNEKYKGDALLQKSFTTNFLEKTHKKNEGELPQYYIQDSHPAIIDPEIFVFVQSELRRREAMKEQIGNSPFSAKIICGDCGGFYGHKVWHSNSKSRNHVWFCNAKYKHDKPCGSPTLREEALKQAFMTAANSILGDKTVYIEHLKKIITDIDNDNSLEEQLTAEEITYAEAVSELRTLIEINAHRSQNQQAYLEEFERLDLRYKESETKISQLKIAISEQNARRHRMNMAIEKLYSISDILTEFDKTTWNTIVESATIHKNGKITFLFRDGSKKTVVIPDISTAKL